MATKTTVRSGAEGRIAVRAEFDAGNLRGTKPEGRITSTGKLPEEWASALDADQSYDPLAYVVWSYQTPIAWVTADGDVCVPTARYSVSTSKHQAIVRRALT